jgi:cytochrome c oxidase subunit III
MLSMTSEKEKKQKMHPHKFTLYVAMGSIVMMFAGFTSAYIVKRNQANWREFELPLVFAYSTAAIVLSSITVHVAYISHKARMMQRYKTFITISALLGVLFVVLQWMGFSQLQTSGIKMIGKGSTASSSFIAAIAGMHILHVLGGVVLLLVMLFKAFSRKTRTYSSMGVEVAATYWHFVDLLWVYLFIFFKWIN